MALHFHKIPVFNSAKTLKNLISRYAEYTKKVDYPTIDEDSYEMCRESTALLESAINQIKEGRENLTKLYNEIREEYQNCKNKSDKKDIMLEIEQIENESQLHKELASADELIFMLTARHDESKCIRDKMGVKLGYISQKSLLLRNVPSESSDLQNSLEQDQIQIETNSGSDNSHSQATSNLANPERAENNAKQCRSIKPPQATLPKFYGNAEDFPEYWAIFETLVHNSPELDVMEKILLLKESLKGRAQASIKGIKLVPQNYKWIIQTLKENYGNQPTNRSQVVQKLVNLKKASNLADSCSAVFDQIQILINQMVSAGYNVRDTCDPMWVETILAKFPHDIVKPVLLSNHEQERQTIGNLIGQLKKEIAAKGYVENRLGHKYINTVTTPKDKYPNPRLYSSDQCLFCQKGNHSSMTCRTVTDQGIRRKILTEGRRCWKCCSSNHSSFDCQKPDCPKCGQKHHPSICFKKESELNRNQVPWNANKRGNTGQNNPRLGQSQREQGNASNHNGQRRTSANNIQMHSKNALATSEQSSTPSQLVLMTAEGNVWNHNKEEYEKALFFFDSGAQKTVIEESLAESLGVPKHTTEVCTMSGIGGHIECFKSHIVNIKLSTVYGEELELRVQTKPVITNGFPSVNLSPADVAFLKSNRICLANSKLRGEHQRPHILVGLDHYHELVAASNCTMQTPTGLHIANTVFGPTIYGKGALQTANTGPAMSYGMTSIEEHSEQEILQKMFELDGLGISAEESQKSDKALEYLTQYSKKVSFCGGFITAPFPLKDNISQLEDNYGVAIRRLESLQTLLQKNQEQCHWYMEILKKYEREGMIEQFSTSCRDSAGIYYMPHSGVWRSNKKVPLRIVFDASSKKRGKLSLNDVIEKGESFINKIHDILLTSRASKIVLLCDIEAAFTQVRLVEHQKDLCRFLWLKNINHPPTKDNIVYYRFRRLPFGVTASPSILNMALMAYLNNQSTELAKEISQNLYVDNILMQAETAQEALRKYRESKGMFAKIGMNLREYISNSKEVNNLIPIEDKLEFGPMKLLGVNYNTESDTFTLSTRFPTMSKLTKKDIVSQINSVYDPIGLAGPLLVRLKSMMRDVFEMGTDWKTVLPPHVCQKWNQLSSEVNNARISVPRTLSNDMSGENKCLWAFADASNAAIAACAYLQGQRTNIVSPLICGKTKLTPKKTRQTIPRLELVGILMAVRLSHSILSSMKSEIKKICVVSDSEIALYWLKTSKKVPVFVSNQRDRIMKIRDQIQENGVSISFLHVITSHNPADAGTRGLTAKQICDHDWIKGPRWLESDATKWPLRSIDTIENIPDEHDEKQPEFPVTIQTNIETQTQEKLIDLSRFSNLNKALRTVSIVGKAIRLWVAATNSNRGTVINLKSVPEYDTCSEISSRDFELSEKVLITQEQKHIITSELQKRFHDKKIVRDNKGIIRHESRLQNAAIPFDTKSPIYIPEQSELIRLIIRKAHIDNAHCGKDHTLSVVRQRFWIPRAASAFKKWLGKCATCKRYQGLPLGAPQMPPLPADRVISAKPFENIGCDYMGPFTSKTQEKMYVCLYTCLTTRAVHLEVVENLSTGSFLNSFVRFISRRGVPKLVRSDCGSNFKHGEQIIATMFKTDDATGSSLMTYCAAEKITWLFNPPGAPWMGGAWERLVGSVKKALNKSIGRKRLSFTEMCTVLARIEAVLNTRPLTKPSSGDLSIIPLRPVDFLQGNVRFSLPQGEDVDSSDLDYSPDCIQSEKQAMEAFRFSEEIATKFWERWRIEYLVSLREIQKSHLRQPRHLTRTFPNIGEIVLIEQDLIPRGNWPYGRVTEIITSPDGFVRSAKILTPNHNVIHRPLNKIYPLEIRSIAEKQDSDKEVAQTADEELRQSSSAKEVTKRNTVETRQSLPRESKTRAYDLFRSMDSDSNQSYVTTSISSSLIFIAISLSILISPTMAINNSSIISCSNGVISVPPIKGWFELCIDNDCQSMNNTTRYIKYLLPISPTEKGANVQLRTLSANGVQEQHWLCERPKFCEHQYLLSKSLLGNPHCWPAGAIATSAVLIYLIIAAFMFTTWVAVRITRKMKSHRVMVRPENNETDAPSAPICSFELTPLPSAMVALCALACLVSPIGACQYGFMRHSADLVCNENNRCHLEYSRELLFNRLQSELCIEILHANKTVGSAKFVKKAVEFECSKITEFFTRPTKSTIYQSKRCANAGSCIENKCDRLKQNETVPELSRSAKYPGYSGCMNSCGGMFCGCFLPLPSCWFYKIAHRPVSDRIFEITQCPHWTTTVKLDIEITIANLTKKVEQSFIPYMAANIDNFNVTVISIQRPLYPLEDKRFAISKDEAYMLPPNFKLPVACSTPTQALQEFNTCSNRVQCSCGSSPYSCQCPHDSFQKISGNLQSILPLKTPHANIMTREGSIVATSNEEEMVLRIESKMLQDVVAELTINQECGFKISKLTGCYDCTLGAHFTAICKSLVEATVTVTCQTQQFLVKCGPSDEENEIILHFNHPTVHEQCNAHCSDRPTKFLLNGTLHYHLLNPLDVSAFGIDTHGVPLKHQWFSDITIPNIDPLLDAITGHWKLTLAAIGTVSGLLALTYFGGPMMLLYLFASVNSVIINFLKFVWNTIICCWDAVWVKNSTADITTA